MTLEEIIADICGSMDGITTALTASVEQTRDTAGFARDAADRLEQQATGERE